MIDPATYVWFNSAYFKLVFSTISRILEIAGGNGGVFWLKAANILIKNCTFVNNQAYIGGVGYLWKHSMIKSSQILINNSNFLVNLAGPTSGVFNFGTFDGLNAEISACNFTGNKGKCNHDKILKLIYVISFFN